MSWVDINVTDVFNDTGGVTLPSTNVTTAVLDAFIPLAPIFPEETSPCTWNDTMNQTVCGATSENPHGLLPAWLNICLGILAGSISILTILGNLTVLLAFVIERSIRQPTNYFLASLAMSDLLIGTFSMPLFTQYVLLGYWMLGPWLCDLWQALDWTVCLTSQYTVFLITLDRFLSVKIPAKYRNWRTERKVLIMVAMTWVLPALIFFISIVGWQFFVPEGRTVKETECKVQFMNDPLFTVMLTIGYFWITLIVMCILYGLIYKVALNLQKKSDAKHRKLQSTMELAAERSRMRRAMSTSSDSLMVLPGKKKKKKKRSEDTLPEDKAVSTTSFSKKNSSEKDDDRSSSPGFASDDDNSSSQGASLGCKSSSMTATANLVKSVDRSGFINNALLPDSKQQLNESLLEDPSLTDTRLLSASNLQCTMSTTSVADMSTSETMIPPEAAESESVKPSVPLLQNDIMKGMLFIDQRSFTTLAQESVKFLTGRRDTVPEEKPEAGRESPVWRRRISFREPAVTIEDDQNAVNSLRAPLAVMDVTASDTRIDEIKAAEKQAEDEKHLAPATSKSEGRITAAQRRRNRKDGTFQNFVKSVRSRNSRRRNRRERKSKSENRARKALRTITLILGAFVLCWTPYHIMVFVVAILGYDGINLRFYYFTYWLCYLNSPINPFCYAFANVQFKRTFLRIFKFDWHKT